MRSPTGARLLAASVLSLACWASASAQASPLLLAAAAASSTVSGDAPASILGAPLDSADAPASPPPGSGTVSRRGASQLELETALPSDFRDLQRRVIARFSVDFAPVLGSFTGEPTLIGAPASADTLRESSSYLNGNLALGTRGILHSTLNTYVLGGAGFDLSGVPALDAPATGMPSTPPSAHPSVYDRFPSGRALLLHLAYGELEGITEEGVLSHVLLRAGRQYHWGTVGVAFDGATLGYDDEKLHVLARAGQRSAVFNRTDDAPGVVLGANAGYTFDLGRGRALSLEAEWVHYQRDLTLTARDQRIAGVGVETVDLDTDVGELSAALELASNMVVSSRISFVRPDVSHIFVAYEWAPGRFSLRLDFDEKIGNELIYDLASVDGVVANGLNSNYEAFRLNIPNAQPYTDLAASLGYDALEWLELEAHPNARFVHGDPANRSPYDSSWIGAGGAVRGRFRLTPESGLETTLAYDGLFYLRDQESIAEFRRLGGENVVHEVSAGATYARGERFIRGRMLGGRTLGLGLGGFLRSASFDNPLLTTSITESAYGVRASADWSFSTYASARVAYELAQDSNLFTPYLGAFHHVRAGIEGRF